MKNYKEQETLYAENSDRGKRLDAFVNESFDYLTRSYIQKLIEQRDISIEGKEKIKSGNKLKGNEKILVRIPEDEVLDVESENIPLEKVYEDRDLVIINKSPDMVVHPAPGNYSGTLVNALMYHVKDLSNINGIIRPGIVHRLDKNTSGLIVIAKNDSAHLKLSEMFKNKDISKTYICICKGIFSEKEGRIENLIGRNPKDRKKMAVVQKNGKNAISNYRVLDESGDFSLVEVSIETGRTHQIRVHMKSINHPILGDEVYGKPSKICKRQMLHAYRLEFHHPLSREKMTVFGDIPEDFKNAAKKTGLDINKVNI
ncbi:RluA family pseudouridine synthase [uncultured Ilyobacter sp.]|uniref:RluA family pseudouridine synthase n=1 Tax=uncultured Ilyobacter sp. TaxID=544433 RepID=UPI0029C0CE03|nr:RluA family pseudouridine synthase [uncultured Ilyobacter sp.]